MIMHALSEYLRGKVLDIAQFPHNLPGLVLYYTISINILYQEHFCWLQEHIAEHRKAIEQNKTFLKSQ